MYQIAKSILNHQKLVAFPEGGIVKDRRTLNRKGQYDIYSRSMGERRKQHTGPAVIALAVSVFKASIRTANEKGNLDTLRTWAKELGIKDLQQLIKLSEQPTLIIPCSITFYPIRIGNNFLKRSVEFFYSQTKKRFSEELLIEGNFLLKKTDMNIQLGEPIVVEDYWSRWESKLLSIFTDAPPSLQTLLESNRKENTLWSDYLFKPTHRRNINKIRDAYMHAIYSSLTINMAHIASTIISHSISQGEKSIDCDSLHTLIYLCIKDLQTKQELNFHKTLVKPTIYRSVLYANSASFEQFLYTVTSANLLQKRGQQYTFQPALLKEYHFDEVRYENPLAVYANEAAPIPEIKEALQKSLSYLKPFKCADFADKLYDDELREYELDLKLYQHDNYQKINAQQTMQLPHGPLRLIPKKHNGQCVVMTHGLMASPGEVYDLAQKLSALGYIVLGTRLKGHATSPLDLHTTTWRDWLASVKQNIRIAECYTDEIHLIGFSSGSLLNLQLATNIQFQSIVACSTPIFFTDPAIKFVKAVSFINKCINTLTGLKGLMPFRKNPTEHPHLNYSHVSINAANELLSLIKSTQAKLKKITSPTLLLQADNDPVVKASSMEFLLNEIDSEYRQHQWLSSNRHGVLYENSDNCQQHIIDFIVKHSK